MTLARSPADAPTRPDPPATAPTMRAIVQDGYGSTEVLRLDTVAIPSLTKNDVLIDVRAASIDRATWHLMTGRPYLSRLVFGLKTPKAPIPGFDVAGIVTAIGANVSRFAAGDRVFGFARGSFAEYAAADENKLAAMADDLGFETAAAVPGSGLTALLAIDDVARVASGQSVLIIGASGGVGSFATQLATQHGAHVTGVCRATKAGFVRSLGATRVIDYTSETIESAGTTYDVVIDIGGNTSLRRLRRVLARRGTLVIVGGEGGGRWFGGIDRQLRALAISPFIKQRLTTFITTEHHAGLDRLAVAIASGTLRPAVTKRYALADVPQAIEDLVAGQIAGKAVIVLQGVTEEIG